MDHAICINQNSFPAPSVELGQHLFHQSIQGVLALNNDEDRFLFYLDSNEQTLLEFDIAPNYTLEAFIEDCGDPDLALFLYDVEDKSPALDALTREQLEDMAQYQFYLPNQAIDAYPDVYALAWAISGYLLSIATATKWQDNHITIARADEQGRYINELLTLRNIHNRQSGNEHFKTLHQIDISTLIHPHVISTQLVEWFNQQQAENKAIIIEKLRLACTRQFKGGKPLFDTLSSSNGIRELRMSAFAGGAIRILFKHLINNNQALLNGFIKKSDNEGYDTAESQANDIFAQLKQGE